MIYCFCILCTKDLIALKVLQHANMKGAIWNGSNSFESIFHIYILQFQKFSWLFFILCTFAHYCLAISWYISANWCELKTDNHGENKHCNRHNHCVWIIQCQSNFFFKEYEIKSNNVGLEHVKILWVKKRYHMVFYV